jgi:hypothetical protein
MAPALEAAVVTARERWRRPRFVASALTGLSGLALALFAIGWGRCRAGHPSVTRQARPRSPPLPAVACWPLLPIAGV